MKRRNRKKRHAGGRLIAAAEANVKWPPQGVELMASLAMVPRRFGISVHTIDWVSENGWSGEHERDCGQYR